MSFPTAISKCFVRKLRSQQPHLKMAKGYFHMSPRRGRIIERLRENEVPIQAIASSVGLGKSSVYPYLSRVTQQTAKEASRRNSFQPKYDPRGERALVNTARKERRTTLGVLAASENVPVSTVRRVLAKNGITKKRAATKPFLSEDHRRKRLDWCRQHENGRPKTGTMSSGPTRLLCRSEKTQRSPGSSAILTNDSTPTA